MLENIAEIPVVHEQVIVQVIPDVIVPLPPAEEFSAPVYDQVHQEQIAASEMTVDFAEIPVVHEQVIVGVRLERLVDVRLVRARRVRLSWVLHRWPVPLPRPSMKAPSHSSLLRTLRG